MDTRSRLLVSARRLFQEKGYGSTSIADILREAEANSGSLYHYFATKQDLLVAVLETYRDGIGEMLLGPAWEGVDDPLERVFALLGRYRDLLQGTDFRYGCPIGNLALELHEPDPPVRELLEQNFDAWKAAVRECLEEAQDALPPEIEPDKAAALILSIMEGGVMQARIHRSLQSFDAGVELLRRFLEHPAEVQHP